MRTALVLLMFALSRLLSGEGDQSIFQTVEAGVRSVQLQPDSEANRLALAKIYLSSGQNHEAVETLKNYLHSHASSAAALKWLAAAFLRQENYREAKGYAAQACYLTPTDAMAVHLLAMAELGLQNTVPAENLLRGSLQLDPNLADSNFQLGLLYTRNHERLSEAITLLQKARLLQPGLAVISTALGSAFLAAEKSEQAIESLEFATKTAPESAQTWYVLADAYRRTHQDQKAERAIHEFERLNANLVDRRARELRSRAFYDEGLKLLTDSNQKTELDRAYALFDQAIHEVPTLDAGYYRKAQVSYLGGDVATALGSIREALRLNSLEPEYYYVQAKCLESTDASAALESARKAVSLRPAMPDFEELVRDLENKKQ